MESVFIDGSAGEGGGQILRTSLALACVTGRAVRIENIREARRNPGLAKQHLSCVQAACAICNGKAEGAYEGSKLLDFSPGPVRSGEFSFDVGSAGSATLVMQTVLPALFLAEGPSTITVTGGTHNPLAPPFDFFRDTFLLAIADAGFHCNCELLKHGFFPAGGGKMSCLIQPRDKYSKQTINLRQRHESVNLDATIYLAKLPSHIAQKQQRLLRGSGLDLRNIEQIVVTDSDGPGNAVCVRLCDGERTAVFTAFGMRGKPSEQVIDEVVRSTQRFIAADAAVDPFLADQLLIYIALCGAGSYTTSELTQHAQTNMEVTRKFLPVNFNCEPRGTAFEISCRAV